MDLLSFFNLFGCIVHVYFGDLIYIHYIKYVLVVSYMFNAILNLFTYLSKVFLKAVREIML